MSIYSYEANRVLSGSPESVRSGIGSFLRAVPAWRVRLLADETMRQTVAVVGDALSDEAEIWLSWELEPLGDDTNVRVVLDETELGPDPDLEELLDLLALYLEAATDHGQHG